MSKFVRIRRQDVAEVAQQVVKELERGLAVVPMLGGYCVLSRDSGGLSHFTETYRLARGTEAIEPEMVAMDGQYRGRVLEVMTGPVVGRLGEGRMGLALAAEPLAREILRLSGQDLVFGVPEEEAEPGELADELGRTAAIVVTGAAAGPGPTIVDFGRRPAQIDRRGKLAILDLEQQLGETVRLGPDMVFSALVVCTGNACRSPMAHAMLAGLLDGVPAFVCSAGTGAPVGSTATPAAVEVMREVGLDLTRHRAQQLDPGMIRAADLILVMEHAHRNRVVELVPEATGRTRLLLSFLGRDDEVDDPIGQPIEVYRRTLGQMAPALDRVAADIRFRAGQESRPAGIQTKEN